MEEIVGTRHMRTDPKRRGLRHTYQEGPGFRFLATNGGRPRSTLARTSDLAVVRERARLLRVVRDEGLAAALARGDCSRRSLFRWQAAYAAGGLAGLIPEPRGPRTPPTVPALAHLQGWLETLRAAA